MTSKAETQELKKLFRLLGERAALEAIGMPEHDIVLLELCYKKGLTAAQLSKVLKVPEQEAYQRYQRSLMQVTRRILLSVADVALYKNVNRRMMALERENEILRIELSILKSGEDPDPPMFVQPEGPMVMAIDEIGLPTGIEQKLRNAGVSTVTKLVRMTEHQVQAVAGMGSEKLKKVKKVLADLGLALEM